MATKAEIQNHDAKFSSLGIKVEGDLGEIQIAETSDCDLSDDELNNDEKSNSQAIEKLPQIQSIVQSATIPVLSNVCVSNSENVQFGNNTYFHGPVTIKQIIKKKGIDNASYTPTDNENGPATSSPKKQKCEEISVNKFKVPSWVKVTASVASVTTIGIICAIFIRNHSLEEKRPPDLIPKLPDKDPTIKQDSMLTYKDQDFNASVEKAKVKADPLLIAPNHLRIVSRTDWLAQPVENELDKIRQPVPWVIITHTATEGCSVQSQCVLRVRLIQMFHIESKQWDDIGYNFLVAGDGSAYYGRGWDYIGAHTLGYNRYSMGIAFIGTFNNETPPQKQIEACQKLIKLGVQLGKIRKDYKLFAHRQLASTLSPGDKLYDIIKEWPHFVKNNSNINELTPKDY